MKAKEKLSILPKQKHKISFLHIKIVLTVWKFLFFDECFSVLFVALATTPFGHDTIDTVGFEFPVKFTSILLSFNVKFSINVTILL